MVLSFLLKGIFFILLFFIGWILLSFTAGIIIYFSTLTVKKNKKIKSKTNTESKDPPITLAHTKDQTIMIPLNEAKKKWNLNRENKFFDELVITSSDNLKLKGYYWATDKKTKTVVLVHGIMDSAAGMAYLAEQYHQRGWSVLSIDLRCHGESEGVQISMGIKEAEDLSLWIDLLITRYQSTEIYLHGVSMGGATVLLYAGRSKNIPSEVKGVISDSSFGSYDEVFSRLLRSVIGVPFIAWSIIWGTSVASALFSGVWFRQISPEAEIKRSPIPVLLFHGQKDILIPLDTVKKMFETAKLNGNDSFVINHAPHIGSFFYESEFYMHRIEEFVKGDMSRKDFI